MNCNKNVRKSLILQDVLLNLVGFKKEKKFVRNII